MTPLKLPSPSQTRLPLLEALREHEGLSAGAERLREQFGQPGLTKLREVLGACSPSLTGKSDEQLVCAL